jgi:1-acyl-sn-glycerol-3-phosphate acyltransferase
MQLVLDAVGARLGQAGRWAGELLFTAWVLIVLLVTLPVLWVWLLCSRPGRPSDRAAKNWARMALGLCGVRPQLTGLQHLRSIGSAVLVANHASYIDPLLLMAALPVEFTFVAKAGLVRYPLIGLVIRKAGYVKIEKASLSERLAGADDVELRLRNGERLVVFPEGTFRRAAALLPFRLGAFRAAVETGRPVVPMAIAGARHILPEGASWLRYGRVAIAIGQPLVPGGKDWPEIVRLRDESVAHIERALEQSDL